MKTSSKNLVNAISYDVGNVITPNANLFAFVRKHFRKISLLILLALISVMQGYATTTVSLSTPTPVGVASICPGINQVTIYAFTLTASGTMPTANFTDLSFTQSGTATNADIIQYQLWSGTPGSTLVATSATTSFTGFSTTYTGKDGTTINYWITADISPAATAGRTIIVNAMTTANFTTSAGSKATSGTIIAGGTQTVLLAPASITGTASVCEAATTTLSNGISGGTWSSANTSIATAGLSTGIVTGVSAGTTKITYQLSTGCLTTIRVTVIPLPAIYNVTGGGSFCAGDPGVHVGLSWSDTSVYYQLFIGLLPFSDPMGIGAPLDFGLQTTAGIYTVMATDQRTSCARSMYGTASVNINPLPVVYSVTGGGALCAGGAGYHIDLSGSDVGINYQLYNGITAIGSPLAGTGSIIDFGIFTTPGNYTVIATDATTFCTKNMSGSATITVNPLPAVFSVTGGGNYCSGGTGVTVGLNGSETGINYVLYLGGITIGGTFAGTGLPINFGLQTAAGNYTVAAINITTSCTNNMDGSAKVGIDPLPAVYTVTGGGIYCAGGTGVHVGLSSSDIGILYLLYNGALIGAPVPGTGAALDFGLQTLAGSYTVVAINATTACQNNMAGAANISINPLPALYTVTGGGSYCAGGAGVHVGLSGSDAGIYYQLYTGIMPTGDPAGTGAPLDFGLQTMAGSYTVIATDTLTFCSRNMSGSALVIINPLPPVHNVTGGGNYCSDGKDRFHRTTGTDLYTGLPDPVKDPLPKLTAIHVGLDGSDPGMIYMLYNGMIKVAGPIAGTGAPLDFGPQSAAGIYTVDAIDAATLCNRNMAGNAVITVNLFVTPTVSIFTGIGNTLCEGSITTFHALTTNGGSLPSYLWKVNGITVSHSSSYSYVAADGDKIFTELTSNELCALPPVVTDYAAMTVIPPVIPSVTISAYPGTHIAKGERVTFTAQVTKGGTDPYFEWFVNGIRVPGVMSQTFITSKLSNKDSVTCIVTRNDACAMTSFNSVYVTVGLDVTQVTSTAMDVSVMPNPNNGTFIIKGSLGVTGNTEVFLEMTNMLGQVVYKNKVIATDGIINEQVWLSNMATGLYILNVRTANENKAVHVIVQ